MKIDFTVPIADLDGEPIIGENEKAVTLGKLAVEALTGTLIGPDGRPENLQPADKFSNAMLAQAIHLTPDAIDLEAEQVALLKDRIGRMFQPLAVMQAWNLLDPKAKK